MGSALARAAQKGAPEGTALYLANRTPEKAQALCRELPAPGPRPMRRLPGPAI